MKSGINAARRPWPPQLRALILAFCLLPACAPADPSSVFTATVGKVMDGDSFFVKTEGGKVEVRLQGIDCPEGGQPYGDEARRFTREFLKGRTLTVEDLERDRYGRTLARVSVGGRDLANELVRAGLAWHYKRYSWDKGLEAAEREARRAKRGLWADARPVPPWKWRKSHPRTSADR